LLSGGGTGGHVYPALTVADELKRGPLQAVLYVGTVGGLEASIVTRAGVDFDAVHAAGLRGLGPAQALASGFELLRGSAQAWGIVRRFRPDVVLATGGYASIPVVLAAWLQRRPALIYLPDIEPGWAIQFLARLAGRVAVSFEGSLRYFRPGQAVVTGYPVRQALYTPDRQGARERLGLAADEKTVLVFGGSRGAHSINQAVGDALERLLGLAQVLHIAGPRDVAWLSERRAQLPPQLQARYHLYEYLYDEMVDALRAADVAVARAGAATMGEFAALGLPSILVPYPYAGQHQDLNADYLVSQGAACKIRDADLEQGALLPTLAKLLADEGALRAMAESAHRLARQDAAQALAEQLSQMAGGK